MHCIDLLKGMFAACDIISEVGICCILHNIPLKEQLKLKMESRKGTSPNCTTEAEQDFLAE